MTKETSIANEYFGRYSGSVKAEWLDDGRFMKLLEDFQFEDPNGMTWVAPIGSLVDGASIPVVAWSIVGSPFTGRYRDASVIHDVACQEKMRSWEVVHLAFYYAMRTSRVSPLQAKIMYAAVHHFGPRWSLPPPASAAPKRGYSTPEESSSADETSAPGQPHAPVTEPATIQEKTFEEMVTQIEAAEHSANPLSPAQIRQLR